MPVLRLVHILAAVREYSLFAFGKNILHMMSPSRFNVCVADYVVHKNQRWDYVLTDCNFTIDHIPGASLSAPIISVVELLLRRANVQHTVLLLFASQSSQRITLSFLLTSIVYLASCLSVLTKNPYHKDADI